MCGKETGQRMRAPRLAEELENDTGEEAADEVAAVALSPFSQFRVEEKDKQREGNYIAIY